MIRTWHIDGYSRREINARLKDEFPRVPRQTRNLWAKQVFESFATDVEDIEKSERHNLGVQLARYEMMYRLAIQQGNLKDAKAIADKLTQLMGLKPAPETSGSASAKTINVFNVPTSGIPDMSSIPAEFTKHQNYLTQEAASDEES